MKLISLSNLSTFASEVKAKYAELGAFNELKDRVDGLVATGGEANVLEGVKVNGTALTIADKMVDILVATGSEDGTVSVNGANVAVAGLKALAFKANVSEAELDAALLAVINAKAEASDVTALAGRVTTAEGAITKLNGDAETEGSVDYKIAQAVAAIMENPDETMNSIQELVTWIDDHATDALEMNNQITANKNNIAALTTLVGNLPEGAASTTVVDYIAEAIGALGIGDYAKTSEVTAAISAALASYYTKTEIDNKFAGYYTKTEVDGKLGDYAKTSEVDGKLADYAKTADVNTTLGNYYTKSEVYAKGEVYAKSEVYTKGEVDTALDAYVLDSDIEAVTESEIKALLA